MCAHVWLKSYLGANLKDTCMSTLLTFVLLVFMPAICLAQDKARINVTIEQSLIRVAGEADVQASRAVAWNTLTDYESWPRFIPDLQISQIVSRTPLRVGQRGTLPWLPGIPMVVLANVVETPRERVSFSKIQGNLLALEGLWQISGKDGALRLSYTAEVVPGFTLPASLTSEIIQADTRNKLEAMAREITRRAQEGSLK
jgi:carbon monoxide dehydrogenase subunit G